MPSASTSAAKPHAARLSASELKRLVHKGLVLHFMLQLSLGDDADARLLTKTLGRVHHRILYFAHFTPGITVSELLAVLGVKHQNIQAPLRQLIADGFILSRASELRIPLMADSDSISIADSVPGDGGHVARVS